MSASLKETTFTANPQQNDPSWDAYVAGQRAISNLASPAELTADRRQNLLLQLTSSAEHSPHAAVSLARVIRDIPEYSLRDNCAGLLRRLLEQSRIQLNIWLDHPDGPPAYISEIEVRWLLSEVRALSAELYLDHLGNAGLAYLYLADALEDFDHPIAHYRMGLLMLEGALGEQDTDLAEMHLRSALGAGILEECPRAAGLPALLAKIDLLRSADPEQKQRLASHLTHSSFYAFFD